MTKIFKTPFGALGDKQEVPTPTQSDGSVSYEQGFGVDYQRDYEDPQAKDIPREGLNQLFYDITKALGELQELGFMQWQAGRYQAGNRVVEGGVVYRALKQTSQKPPHADWVDDTKAVTDALNTKADKSVTITASTGLSGGGNLSANRTLSVNYGTTAGTSAQGNDSRIVNSVQIIGDQTIGGVKTFSLFPVGPISVPSTPHQLANKRYVDSMSFGHGQAWMNMTASRAIEVAYTNTSGRTRSIKVTLRVSNNPDVNAYIYVNDVISSFIDKAALNSDIALTAEVPNNSEYRVAGDNVTLVRWSELR